MSRVLAAAVAVALALTSACGGERRISSAVPPPASTGERIVLVVLGGDETDDPPSSGSLTQSWEQLVFATLPTSAVLVDLADRRQTARGVAREQLPRATALHPTVATVWLGATDHDLGTDEAEFRDHLDQIVTGLQQAGARKVLLLSRRGPDPATSPDGPDDDGAATTVTSDPAAIGSPDLRHRYPAVLDDVAARTGAQVVVLPGEHGQTQASVAAAVRPLITR